MALDDLLTIEDGARLYVEYVEKHKEESKSITGFFMRYDVENKEFHSAGYSGHLSKYYGRFKKLNKKNQLPKGIATFKEWIGLQIPKRLKQRLEKQTEKYLPKKNVREYSLEQGVEFYIQHLEEHKEESKPIAIFFVRYDVENNEFHPKSRTGHLSKYYNRFGKLNRKNQLPKGIATFEDWLKPQISEKVKQRLENLTGKYLRECSLEQGVEFYIQHLEECKEESKSITRFFMKYDVENRGFHPERSTGQLSKYYGRFKKLNKKNQLPKGIATFKEWIGLQIPRKQKQKLEKLTGKYFKEYPLEQGVEFYIQHLEEHREESKSITWFFKKYDVENNGFHPENKAGRLNKYYNGFSVLKKDGKLPEGIITFEDYLIHHLPEEKRERAEYYLKGQFLKDIAKREIDREQLKIVVLGGN